MEEFFYDLVVGVLQFLGYTIEDGVVVPKTEEEIAQAKLIEELDELSEYPSDPAACLVVRAYETERGLVIGVYNLAPYVDLKAVEAAVKVAAEIEGKDVRQVLADNLTEEEAMNSQNWVEATGRLQTGPVSLETRVERLEKSITRVKEMIVKFRDMKLPEAVIRMDLARLEEREKELQKLLN